MRKNIIKLGLACVVALSFTACGDDQVQVWCPTDEVSTSNGLFVVGSGSNYSGINGDLTYYDYNTKKATLKAFQVQTARVSVPTLTLASPMAARFTSP